MQLTLNNEVRRYREERSLTQQELADKVGVTRQTIIALEKGNYTPSLLLAFKICIALEETIDSVFNVVER
ncbi:helix-turn-helix transcriptional regulator [candidate division WWE3 bacterium]|uniref:Helix-turn-helix transcriptional regulator n=1 Tax=candidate division WWE3 bacterium TaxID=2053526 RepID=A0A955LKV2_UNCKA|nr:helix-turn-helix transcriptional regulator [candidate division WWE3 bacterium]